LAVLKPSWHQGFGEYRLVAGQISLSVQDDGKGISDALASFRPGSIGVGIGGMRQRVSELGGELHMMNAHPGTVVEVSIPLQGDYRHE
jgi:signal transduction histidine kinase